MSLLYKLVFFLFLAGLYTPSYATDDGAADLAACDTFNEADDGKGDKKEGGEKEEEPDCE
jgi:hypothetical protein